MRAFLLVAFALFLLGSSCRSADGDEILVFAAASLTEVMDELRLEFTRSTGVEVNLNLGGSSALAQQIIRGAPADAFVSAGALPMDKLDEKGRIIPDTRVDLLTNELVVVGSSDEAAKSEISSVEDLAGADVRVAIADPDLAPAGRYTREALSSLGLWQRLKPQLVFSSNVRVALGYVETGNADLGIVYQTDMGIGRGLEVLVAIPRDSHSLILYPGAVLDRSDHVEAAREFLLFLKSEEAAETFRAHGFIPTQ